MTPRKTFFLFSFLLNSYCIASDTVSYFGKIKSVENNKVSIELTSKEVISGKLEDFSRLDTLELGFQIIEIEKKHLHKINNVSK